jgi:2-desacetyl-2-hydroxyethyl bacteriochlorophyllide A dehydrogenase
MKALVYYGPEDLRLTYVEDLKPGEKEVLIKVKACGICGSDIHGYLGITGRRVPPMIMGHEFSGQIIEVGREVNESLKGKRVVVQPINFCGECEFCKQGLTNLCKNKKFFGVMDVNGAMAEYISVPEKLVFELKDNVDFIEGTFAEPLAVAFGAVNKVNDLKGKNIFIVGAGTIGLLILQVVKTKDPASIIISDLDDFRLEIAKNLGVDYAVNPNKIDLIEFIKSITDGEGVDYSFEAVGATATVQQAMSVLKTKGTCVWVGNSAKIINIDMQNVVTREINILGTYTYTHYEFGKAVELLSTNNLKIKPMVSKIAPLDEGPEMMKKLAKSTNKYIKVILVN